MSATSTGIPAGTYGFDPVHSTIGFVVVHRVRRSEQVVGIS